jgi:hypothetical protein
MDVKYPAIVSRLVVSFEDFGVFKREEALRSDFDTFILRPGGTCFF